MFERKLTRIVEKKYQNQFELIDDFAHWENDKLNNADAYAQAVMEREKIIATYVGFGIAIPHAICEAVKEPFVLYGKLEIPLFWNGTEDEVKHIFMIGVPQHKDTSKQHLKIISQLSKNLMREKFREKLLLSNCSAEVYEMLKTIEKEMEI